MQKIFLFTSLFILLVACNSGNKMSAIEYNDTIVQEQTKITEKTLAMVESIETDLEKCEDLRLETIIQCEQSIATVKAMTDYEGNTRLRDAALALFEFYKDINANEYKEMLNILNKGEEIDEADITQLQTLEQQVGNRETSLDAEFQTAQKEFASKYHLEIEENALQDKIDNM